MWELTFAGPDVVQVQLVALLGSLQGTLGGEEVAGGVEGLVVAAAHLKGHMSRVVKVWKGLYHSSKRLIFF